MPPLLLSTICSFISITALLCCCFRPSYCILPSYYFYWLHFRYLACIYVCVCLWVCVCASNITDIFFLNQISYFSMGFLLYAIAIAAEVKIYSWILSNGKDWNRRNFFGLKCSILLFLLSQHDFTVIYVCIKLVSIMF